MSSIIRRLLALVLCLAMFAGGATVLAAEGTMDVEYISITSQNFVADSLHGVDALYNRNGSGYNCTEYIVRYYKEVYGIDVDPSGNGPLVTSSDDYWFERAEEPKPGDILFAHSSRRTKWYSHWAIVKDYDPETGVMTLIEQNWRWNGQAGINRTMLFPSNVYYCYTLRSNQEITTLHDQAIDNSWASASIRQAEQEGIFTYYDSYSDTVTAEQFCEMVCNLAESLGCTVTDENGEPVSFDSSCAQAYTMGLINADASGRIDPEAEITREQAAIILSRVYALATTPVQTDAAVVEQFADYDQISANAFEPIALMMASGIMQGNSEGSFLPKKVLNIETAIELTMRTASAVRLQQELALLLPSETTVAYEAERQTVCGASAQETAARSVCP